MWSVPDWIRALTVAEIVAVLALASGAVVIARRIARGLRRVGHLVDDLAGEPSRRGVPARPGVMERIAEVETKVETVRKEVTPNQGNSAHDQLSAEIQAARTALTDQVQLMCDQVRAETQELIAERKRALAEHLLTHHLARPVVEAPTEGNPHDHR